MFVLFKLNLLEEKNDYIFWPIRSWSPSWFAWLGRFWFFDRMVCIPAYCQCISHHCQSTEKATTPLNKPRFTNTRPSQNTVTVIFLSKKQLKLNFA